MTLARYACWMLLALIGPTIAGSAAAQAPAFDTEAFVRTHYSKAEYRIPMRDGAKLFVSVYSTDLDAFKDAGPYPFLMYAHAL